MSLRYLPCPLCAADLGIPEHTPVGARARCGSCGELFRVPAEPGDPGRVPLAPAAQAEPSKPHGVTEPWRGIVRNGVE